MFEKKKERKNADHNKLGKKEDSNLEGVTDDGLEWQLASHFISISTLGYAFKNSVIGCTMLSVNRTDITAT